MFLRILTIIKKKTHWFKNWLNKSDAPKYLSGKEKLK